MTLDEAVAELTKEFGAPAEAMTGGAWNAGHMQEICSAGDPEIVEGELTTPALCASREIAVALWLPAVQAFLRERKPAVWCLADGPHLDKFFITMMGPAGAHRTAGERYSVTAKIGTAQPQAKD